MDDLTAMHDPTQAPPVWVVGGRGLLGAAVVRAAGERAWTARVPWATPQADAVLGEAMDTFLDHVNGRAWQIAWCAGAGVTSTTQEVLDTEIAVVRAFCARLRALPADVRSRGSFFLASSAGGVYAGSPSGPPFDESSVPRALAPYGLAKLATEAVVSELSQAGISVVIGRIANLYGPGQNLVKAQGLISVICKSLLTGNPIPVYVPMDTLRDYLFADDAGRLTLQALDRAAGAARTLGESGALRAPVVVKVLCTGQAVSVASIIMEVRRVTRRSPRVILAASSAAAYQARDLRLRSRVWPDLDATPRVGLPVGIATVLAHLRLVQQQGSL